MFDDYAPILEKMKKRMLHISQFGSENIIATVLNDLCRTRKDGLLAFKFNYPLCKIIDTDSILDNEDKNFILCSGTHCDFVVYDKLDKKVHLIIEVDGKQHEDFIQKQRDERKDRIIQEAGLKLIRIRTTDVDVEERILKHL